MLWNGVPLGFTKDGRPHPWAGSAATLACGPPGSGKTVKLICNQLLDDDSGVVRMSSLILKPRCAQSRVNSEEKLVM
jgi:hypothetical protein